MKLLSSFECRVAVWNYIVDSCSEYGGAVPSIEMIAQETAYSASAVGYALNDLRSFNLIDSVPGAPRKLYVVGSKWEPPLVVLTEYDCEILDDDNG